MDENLSGLHLYNGFEDDLFVDHLEGILVNYSFFPSLVRDLATQKGVFPGPITDSTGFGDPHLSHPGSEAHILETRTIWCGLIACMIYFGLTRSNIRHH